MRSGISTVLVGLVLAVSSLVFAQDQKNQTVSIDFNRDIRPILSDTCFACHGPDASQRKAGLRFDNKEGTFAKTGVVVPGNSLNSRLVKRITATEPESRMPPVGSGRALTAKQIELLRRWIDEGAKWETHWAYLPPKRPEPPEVADTNWPRNPIDRFILARLEREGLKPSPPADKITLLRRASLDLTGLPPTPAEIDSFVKDTSADAYEKRVDRLLGSPHYGERMAMEWLDLARYADTHGYHIDSHRDMWRWRDWVINAFNRNMRFDQFTIEQLAGDLLPGATVEQKIASGFNRNHMINYEGGAIPEEYQVEYVVDRVETTSNAWMATTLGCARCHSHKYDPITQKEFYQFFAFFNTVSEEGLDGRTGNAKPFLPLPSNEQKTQLEELTSTIKAREETLSEKEIAPLQEKWEKSLVGKKAVFSRDGLTAHYELDGNFSDVSGGYRHGRTVSGDPTFGSGYVGRSVNFDGDSHVSFGNVGALDRSNPFSIAFWLRGSGNTPTAVLQKIDNPETRRGYEFLLDDHELIGIQRRAAHLSFRLISHWPDSAVQIRTKTRLTLGDWYHVAVSYDGSGKAAGLRLYINGKSHQAEIQQDNLSGITKTDAELQIGNKFLGKPFRGGIDDLRLYERVLDNSEIEQLAIHHPIQTILSGVSGRRSRDETARVRDYFLTYAASDSVQKLYAELKSLRKKKEALDKEIPTVMVMSEMEKPRETFILGRGDYRNKTDKVTPGVPAVLTALPEGAPANRLGLARWLVSPSHPLTARVTVNRYWQMYFGTGIVKSSENFGVQGDPPVHPELLDWLATEFIRNGWDVKALQRLIVTSATYRQSSKVSAPLLEKDPENRLLARGSRLRLPAELVRDNALAISGLLNTEIGGPPVFPYQPKGLWDELAFGDGFSAQTFTPSTNKDLYRRSMYTFWKRTVPPPQLTTFDAPDREKCTARRPLTNTPLQALILMNDPTYLEAARRLAQRAMIEAGRDVDSRIGFVFRAATSRSPSPKEFRVLRNLFQQQIDRYRRDAKAAVELLGVGESKRDAHLDASELAAWTIVSSTILNLDETITKE
ncbi:MAG TPA: DUF1553 domain-containing protein [Blastocatellia bacterium]|nr:DUF1553 domain-containing protein [Blastocatellia bacterium]